MERIESGLTGGTAARTTDHRGGRDLRSSRVVAGNVPTRLGDAAPGFESSRAELRAISVEVDRLRAGLGDPNRPRFGRERHPISIEIRSSCWSSECLNEQRSYVCYLPAAHVSFFVCARAQAMSAPRSGPSIIPCWPSALRVVDWADLNAVVWSVANSNRPTCPKPLQGPVDPERPLLPPLCSTHPPAEPETPHPGCGPPPIA